MPQHSFLMVSHHVWGNCIETRQQSSGMATHMTCSTLQKVVEVPTRHSSLAEINPQEALQNTEVFSCKLLLQALGKNIAACTRLLQKTKGVLNDKAPQCMCKSLQFRIVFLACRGGGCCSWSASLTKENTVEKDDKDTYIKIQHHKYSHPQADTVFMCLSNWTHQSWYRLFPR